MNLAEVEAVMEQRINKVLEQAKVIPEAVPQQIRDLLCVIWSDGAQWGTQETRRIVGR